MRQGQQTQESIRRGLGELRCGAELDRILRAHAGGDQMACFRLDELKASTKKRYRELALELHPDRTNGDEAKAQRFRDVSMAYQWLDDLKLPPAPTRQRPTQTYSETYEMPPTVFVFIRRPAPPAPPMPPQGPSPSFFAQMWPGGFPTSTFGGKK